MSPKNPAPFVGFGGPIRPEAETSGEVRTGQRRRESFLLWPRQRHRSGAGRTSSPGHARPAAALRHASFLTPPSTTPQGTNRLAGASRAIVTRPISCAYRVVRRLTSRPCRSLLQFVVRRSNRRTCTAYLGRERPHCTRDARCVKGWGRSRPISFCPRAGSASRFG
jgi:hypothetical protein